ncbi:hypothetical protein DMB44_03590 [Thermoplasma sp. Kam2015]|uniref:helix-turn-helix domain-containing protein n=1 Tax=Thermoplasma sp. Kam2015 TaxID=2094122 RepID=UPI000D9C4688|nr:helix-turn-helix domain-containing protein [Thermoplasma sp. Kam2015]PYB68436.1 hypothetical protein DMB44_03590 [Thermoplasma sp. Kam2015]
MYYLTFSISSECGLSDAAYNTQSKLFILNVLTEDFKMNSVVAITRSDDIPGLKGHLIKDFNSLNISRQKKYSLIIGRKISHGIMGSIEKNGGMPIYPLLANDGVEVFQVLVLDKEKVDAILDAVSRYNHIESFDSMRLEASISIPAIMASSMSDIMFDLTDTEKNVLLNAYRMGYFSWPRGNDLSNLAAYLKMAKPTALYHLRNAEKKIMKMLFWH